MSRSTRLPPALLLVPGASAARLATGTGQRVLRTPEYREREQGR